MITAQSVVSSRVRLSENRPSEELPAREVHRRLCRALNELQKAERNAVLLFSEVVRRKLYQELGYCSIYQYAELELGFKKSKTAQFLRLCDAMKDLPVLRQSVALGEISWTKARVVAKVATPRTEARWVQEAKRVPRRELERQVVETTREARAGTTGREQVTLELGPLGEGVATGSEASRAVSSPRPGPSTGTEGGIDPATPVNLQFRMTAEQYGRYQALLQAARKQRSGDSQAELILAGLEQLVLGAQNGVSESKLEDAKEDPRDTGNGITLEVEPDRPQEFTRVNFRSPYQVVVQMCPRCRRGTVPTNRGEKSVSPRELRTILCDARLRKTGERNKAAIPQRLRRAVLERDRFRCRAAGCGRTSFLAAHHLVPRETGGANTMDSLITLCSGCHGAVHG